MSGERALASVGITQRIDSASRAERDAYLNGSPFMEARTLKLTCSHDPVCMNSSLILVSYPFESPANGVKPTSDKGPRYATG